MMNIRRIQKAYRRRLAWWLDQRWRQQAAAWKAHCLQRQAMFDKRSSDLCPVPISLLVAMLRRLAGINHRERATTIRLPDVTGFGGLPGFRACGLACWDNAVREWDA